MREILFRGKRRDNGKWVEGNLFVPDNSDKPTEILIGTNVIRISYEVIPSTVGQFTGFTDKNGKKIFEGDIIKNSINWKCRVEYSEARFYPFVAYPDFCSWNAEECEIIGSIHDNLEFLEVTQ